MFFSRDRKNLHSVVNYFIDFSKSSQQMANSCDQKRDNFKPVFKYYKNYLNSYKNEKIIDFSKIDKTKYGLRKISIDLNKTIESPISGDFRDLREWEVFAVEDMEGLLVIPQILKKEASEKWFNYLLKELPFSNSHDLRANISLPPIKPIKDSNLRWISFGYHYDWSSKLYDHSFQSPIPLRIRQLSEYVSRSLGFDEFRGEGGLINYYRNDSTLCPHSDHSEPNQTAPLFSLSLGSSAVFLIGGRTKSSDKPIIPMYLRDSDLLVMSSESRQSFHAIPKILSDGSDGNKNSGKEIKRINLNIRQVY